LARECSTNACIRKKSEPCPKDVVEELEDAYVNTSRSRLQIGVERLYVRLVHFGIDDHCDKLADAELDLDELRVVRYRLHDL
jgi:hypothetical protein